MHITQLLLIIVSVEAALEYSSTTHGHLSFDTPASSIVKDKLFPAIVGVNLTLADVACANEDLEDDSEFGCEVILVSSIRTCSYETALRVYQSRVR